MSENHSKIQGSGFDSATGGFAEIVIDDRHYTPAYIVKCVNAHDELVAIAGQMPVVGKRLTYYSALCDELALALLKLVDVCSASHTLPESHAFMSEARAALAKVTKC